MEGARTRQAAAVVSVLAALCRCALALNPSLDISQYAHNAWTIREGFFKGLILSMAQTPDGYFWLGTEFGLLRFDGVRPVEWTAPGSEHLPSRTVRKLLAARDGTLWIGTSAGLASWKGSKLARYAELETQAVMAILEDREGTVWVGAANSGASGRLCAIRGGKAKCWGQDGSLGAGVLSLYEDSRGAIWAGADSALWRWKPGPPKRYATPEREIRGLIQDDDGELLIGMPNGVRRLENGKALPHPMLGKVNVAHVISDRHRALWFATAGRGLIHVHQGRTDTFSQLEGLSADEVLRIFEDREGNIWVSTYQGLDRFREFAVVTLSAKQGLSGDSVFSVLAARDGSVWLSGRNGLDLWKDGQVTTFRKANGLPDDGPHSLFQDDGGRIWAFSPHGGAYFEDGRFVAVRDVPGGYVASIAGHANHLWVSQDRRLLHLLDGRVVDQSPWSDPGRRQGASVIVADRDEGGIWLGFWAGGLDYLKDGQVRRSYSSKDGLGGGRISDLRVEADNTLWAATESGLSLIKQGHIATLTSKNGLPCDEVYWSMEAADRSTWLYMPCGLARIARTDLEAWISDSIRKIPMTVLDGSDGVTAHVAAGSSWPRVAKSNDGRIWFVSFNGVVSVLDPAHLPFNKLPPPVRIESIIADDKPYILKPGMRLPANVRDVRIEFTALSLVAPEKIHFKYKLEGQNQNWHEVVNERQATYTNLPPRNYRFRVMASNNSGVWNETGDSLEFSIAPAYYQTNWFRALVAATVLAMMWAAYQFRIWQVQRESRRLRDVIETIPAYVWSALPDGFVDFINRRWLEFSGFSLTQALGWGWADAVHPEDRSRLVEAWRGAIAAGKPMEEEARMRGADGQYRWLLFRSVPQRDPSGKIVKWYGKSMDIDDRKRAEETLRETETRFRTYIDHATDAFFVLDFEAGTILDVNNRACKNLGYTREELIGKTVFEFDAGLDPGWLEQNIRPRIEAGEHVTFETRHRRKDGSVFPVEIRARAFQTGGRVVNLSLVQDITERKRSEEERGRLRQLEADLAHINRVSMMGELAASVAHEVNQPLTGIVSNGSACLRFLANDAPDLEEVREAVHDIVRDGKRAGEVIARIRALTKRTALPREKLDLNETIREVLVLVGDEAKKRSVVIRTQFAEDLSPLSGDRVQLQQVMLNLVMNAMDAMSSVVDRERQLVILTQNIDPDRVQVTVEDWGTGLDPKTMARIFEPFYTTKSGGMGMGLSISRSIVQNHGGRLWATANDGPGTRFHFSLPKHQREESAAGAAASLTQ
jgi:PAS domain S-box-containing protein